MTSTRHLGALMIELEEELIRATEIYGPLNSSHEAYGVLLEEVDELWDEIKKNDITKAREEALQVAAIAIRFLMDIK